MRLPCRVRAFLAGLAFLAAVLAPLAPPTARAEGLQRFTGYANPGTPSDKILANGEIDSTADAPKAFGGSIYFMVLDRGEGRGDDTWGTGIKSFDTQFQTGLDDALKPSPGLDKKARYLYLYQVVNDRGSKSPIHEVTIRLIIDPALITSWGYFAEAKKAQGQGPGAGRASASRRDGADAKVVVAPVSTEHPVGPVKRPFVAGRPARIGPEALRDGPDQGRQRPQGDRRRPRGREHRPHAGGGGAARERRLPGAPEIHTAGPAHRLRPPAGPRRGGRRRGPRRRSRRWPMRT